MIDPALKSALLSEAAGLRMSGEPELEARGLVLEVATSREDIPAIRKTLGDLIQMAEEEKIGYVKDAYTYMRKALGEEEEPAVKPVEGEGKPNADVQN